MKGTALAPSTPESRSAAPLPAAVEKDRTFLHCLLIVCIAGAIYLPLIGIMPWNGNEPTRVAVAQDMLRQGHWIVPTLHGKLYLVKPPLMNWLIAGSGVVFGVITEWTSRIPSVLAMLATALAVYLLTRPWLGQDARLSAALATLSMTGLLKKGASAEIDALFILTVTVILLVWLNGYQKRWKPAALWGIPLFLVGVAFLIKGPHAAVYFYLTTGCYLLLRKRPSLLFSRAHLLGIFIAAAVLLLYLSAVLQEISAADYLRMWEEQVVSRGSTGRAGGFFRHAVDFPVDAALSFMPWILFVLPLLHRGLWESARSVLENELVVFALVMIAANFPLYWLLPNAYVRYFLPAGPFVAVVLAAWFQVLAPPSDKVGLAASSVMPIMRIAAAVVCLAAAGIAGTALSKGMVLTPRLGLSTLIIMISAACIAVRPSLVRIRSLAVPVALWVGLFSLLFSDMNLQKMMMRKESPRQAAREISQRLPAGLAKVYEIGSRRILAVTCYLDREVMQLEGFFRLQDLSSEGPVYFLFDTDIFSNLQEEQKAAYDRLDWEKLVSTTFEKGDNEVILGRLKSGD